jgi:hypothetical protein
MREREREGERDYKIILGRENFKQRIAKKQFTLKMFEMMPHGTLKFQIAF